VNDNDFVNHAALRESRMEELVEIADEGGPAAVVDAALLELARRVDEGEVDAAAVTTARIERRARVDAQEEAYERASADVVLALSFDSAIAIADALEYLASVDEGEHTDYDNLVRLAGVVRETIEAAR
jgi:hypothetical protein